jgi:methylmalonyl-CoA/ethylmalonyl-CoA epimerase
MILDHIGIVVPDIDRGREGIGKLLPLVGWTAVFNDPVLGVSVQFARDKSNLVFELIAPLGDNSPVASVVKTKLGVINQLAYRVENLEAASKDMRAAGALPTGAPKPAIAFGGARVQFFYTPQGFVVELIEAPGFSHVFE